MYFSAEHLAAANEALRETFQQCSIAWQTIPHWDTNDPGQINVNNGILGSGAGFLPLVAQQAAFELTVAEAISPTPDALLTGVMAATETLAQTVDKDVLQKCFAAGASVGLPNPIDPQDLQNSLITARVDVENAGYRAPSALVTNTIGLQGLNLLANGYYNILQQTLTAATINSLYRFQPLDGSNQSEARMVLLGRRRRIAQGAAPEAAAGEEPVDIAVSLPPSEARSGTAGFLSQV